MPPTSYPEPSEATAALVVSILGIVLCGLLGPFGWVMANQELAAIAAGRRDPEKKGMAELARVFGIVATVLLALAILALVVFFLFFVIAARA